MLDRPCHRPYYFIEIKTYGPLFIDIERLDGGFQIILDMVGLDRSCNKAGMGGIARVTQTAESDGMVLPVGLFRQAFHYRQ